MTETSVEMNVRRQKDRQIATAVRELARQWGGDDAVADPDEDPVGVLRYKLRHYHHCYGAVLEKAEEMNLRLVELHERYQELAGSRLEPDLLRHLYHQVYGGLEGKDLDAEDLADMLALRKAIEASE